MNAVCQNIDLDALAVRLSTMTADQILAEKRLIQRPDSDAQDAVDGYLAHMWVYDAELTDRGDSRIARTRDFLINEPTPPIWVNTAVWVEADIPPRPWIVPGYLLRGGVTLVVAPGGTMKSLLMLAWATALARGEPYGDFRPVGQMPVVVFNVEDGPDEQNLRLSAIGRQFDVSSSDIAGKVFRCGPAEGGRLFAEDDARNLVPTPAMAALEALIASSGAGVLIADPLAELHGADENANGAMNAVIAAFRGLARRLKIAVVLIHHTRKGANSPGDADTARGGSSIIGAVRIALTLTTMSEEDARRFGMPTDRANRSHYVRLDDAKANYSPIGDARWFEKVVYELDNGERVPAPVPWTPPAPKTASADDLAALATAVQSGARRVSRGRLSYLPTHDQFGRCWWIMDLLVRIVREPQSPG